MIWFFRFSGLVLMVPVEMHVGNQNVMFQSFGFLGSVDWF